MQTVHDRYSVCSRSVLQWFCSGAHIGYMCVGGLGLHSCGPRDSFQKSTLGGRYYSFAVFIIALTMICSRGIGAGYAGCT